MTNFYLQFWKKLGDGVDLLGEGVDLLGEGVDLLGDGVDLLGDGGDPRSIAVGSSKTTVSQKGNQRLEIRKCDRPTNLRTGVSARNTGVSKKDCSTTDKEYYFYKKVKYQGWEIGLIWICNSEYVMTMQTLIPSFETSSFIIKLTEFWFGVYFKFSIHNVEFGIKILCYFCQYFLFLIGVYLCCLWYLWWKWMSLLLPCSRD